MDRAADPARGIARAPAVAARVRERRERAVPGPPLPAEGGRGRDGKREAAGRLAARARARRTGGRGSGPRRAGVVVPAAGGGTATGTRRGVAREGRGPDAGGQGGEPGETLGQLRPGGDHPAELADHPGADAARRLRRRARTGASAAPGPRPRLLAGGGAGHAGLRAEAAGSEGARGVPRLVGAVRRVPCPPRVAAVTLRVGPPGTPTAPHGPEFPGRIRASQPLRHPSDGVPRQA